MMPVSLHLAIRQWLARPLRPVLCSLAIAAAVALVVCVGAGFDSARATLNKMVNGMLGTADIHVRSTVRPPGNRLPATVLETLRARPEVAIASGRMQGQLGISALPAPGTPPDGRAKVWWFPAIGVDPKPDDRLRPKVLVSGVGLDGSADQIVIDESVAKQVGAKAGDTIRVGDGKDMHPVRVVGVVAGPAIELVQQPAVYVPGPVLAQASGVPLEFNVIDLELKPGTAVQDYARKLRADLGTGLSVTTATDGQRKMERETQLMDFALLVLSVVSGICAALIIGTTLSVGVQERVRQFGQLRCIGASRMQLVKLLLADALLLMLVGTALGIAVGAVLSKLLVWALPRIFLAYALSPWSLANALANGLLATLLGSLIPAWQVWRVSPMQAVQTVGRGANPRHIWLTGICGLAALALQAALWQIPQREARFWCYLVVGIPLVFIGYALLGPTILLLLERLGYRAIGRLAALRAPLLRNAWSRTPWRAGGMIAALMIGITLFTAVRERGRELLSAWTFPQDFPDIMMYRLFPTRPDAVERLRHEVPAIAAISPVEVFPVKFKKAMFRIGPVLPDEQTLFLAADQEDFRKLLKLDFVQGDPQTAFAKLKAGNALFVSREYQTARGIGVGDTITLQTPEGQDVDFTIAAVVASPGMDVAKHYFDMGTAYRDKALNSVLGTLPDARKYFHQNLVNLALADVQPGSAVRAVRTDIESFGWQTASAVEMKDKIVQMVQRFVDAMSILAIAAMCLASLGVTNMVIASVHARRFEFGVLRAVGAGRGQLIRLVLAEASLIALTAGILGSFAGLHFAFMASRVDRLMFGYQTTFGAGAGPLLSVLLGIGITVPLGWLASIVPAWRGANAAQQVLLASGRG